MDQRSFEILILLFLKFNQKDQRPQSPTSSSTTPRDTTTTSENNRQNIKVTTSSTTPATPQTAKQQAKPVVSATSTSTSTQPIGKNEKEIVIQRVSSNSNANNQTVKTNTSNSNNTSTPANFADLQVVNNKNNNITPGVSNSQDISQKAASPLGNKNQTTPSTTTTTTTSTTNNNLSKPLVKQAPKPLNIPQFYYPHGKAEEKQFKSFDDSETMKLINNEFKLSKEGKIFREDFGEIVRMLGLPRYWKILLFRACTLNQKINYVTYPILEQVWSRLSGICHDRPSLFMKLMSTSNAASIANQTIVYEDWEPLMQDIVDSHPGLKFLHDHKEFHTRYIKTVGVIFFICLKSKIFILNLIKGNSAYLLYSK